MIFKSIFFPANKNCFCQTSITRLLHKLYNIGFTGHQFKIQVF